MAFNNKKTSDEIASKSGSTLSKNDSSEINKTLSGSTLSQVDRKKQTSKEVASKAGKALNDDRTNADTKSKAGSALAQTRKD